MLDQISPSGMPLTEWGEWGKRGGCSGALQAAKLLAAKIKKIFALLSHSMPVDHAVIGVIWLIYRPGITQRADAGAGFRLNINIPYVFFAPLPSRPPYFYPIRPPEDLIISFSPSTTPSTVSVFVGRSALLPVPSSVVRGATLGRMCVFVCLFVCLF